MIEHLYNTICDRRDHPRSGSYTSALISSGENEILKKIGEESIEVILAAKAQGDERLLEELADLTYHCLVLMAARQLTPDQLSDVLSGRKH